MHAQIAQHAGIDLAGERAVIVLAHVLAPTLMRLFLSLADTASSAVNGGHTHHVHIGLCAEVAVEGSTRSWLRHGFVHLPVAGDDQFTFFVHAENYLSDSADAGEFLAFRNSRLAPPPVLMKVT